MKDIVDVMRVFLRDGTPPDHPLERMLEQVGGLLPHQVMESDLRKSSAFSRSAFPSALGSRQSVRPCHTS